MSDYFLRVKTRSPNQIWSNNGTGAVTHATPKRETSTHSYNNARAQTATPQQQRSKSHHKHGGLSTQSLDAPSALLAAARVDQVDGPQRHPGARQLDRGQGLTERHVARALRLRCITFGERI